MSESAREKHERMLMAHGVVMGLAFAFFFPAGALIIRARNVRHLAWIHGAWQVLAICLALIGLGTGLQMTLAYGRVSLQLYDGCSSLAG